jgi:glycine betaine/proline transport system permease protein
MPELIDIGYGVEVAVEWLDATLGPVFDLISMVLDALMTVFENALLFSPDIVMILLLAALAWYIAGRGVGVFSLIGLALISSMGYWENTMITLAQVATSAIVALFLGVPIGIWASRNQVVHATVRPVLDFMQTMPAFVYLIPAVLFFQLGAVPGVVATVIFSMPPAVRLTNLGIRQVDKEVVEAARSFGATDKQLLLKVQLPLATPTILAGVNQTIMLGLSMVVIAAMIGAGGVGGDVYRGITQMNLGLGFEAGIAIVILAIFLDRITQALGAGSQKQA